MNKDHIQLLYEYDRWANKRVLQAVAALSPEQFARKLGGGDRSVRDALIHIIGGEWGWITYWNESSPTAASLSDVWDRHDALFRADAFPSVESVRLAWAEVEKKQIDFVNALTDGALKKQLPFRATQLGLSHLMVHLANHSTYHRGQVALMMRQLNVAPLATDFHVFLAERSAAPATASIG